MKLYWIDAGEHFGCGNITITADKKKAKRLAKLFNGYIHEEEAEHILNNEEEIMHITYFRYPEIGERLDLVKDDIVHAAKILRGFEGENK